MLFLHFLSFILSVSLSGQQTGNKTETFVGFIFNVYNEFEDEPSGHFVAPLPQGVKKEECHYKNRSFMVSRIY